jgi:putative DNA primase/helicase
MTESASQFREVIRSAGLSPPNDIEPEKLYRIPGADKRSGNAAGWCKLFADGTGGVYGDWSRGLSATWQAKRCTPFTDSERAAFQRNVAESKANAERERRAKQRDAAAKALAIWNDATPVTDEHPYLLRKVVKANGAKLHRGALVVAARDGSEIHSLQFINDAGEKRFLADGRITGCYFSIGSAKGATVLCIAEGFATGATIQEVTGYPVAVAFNAGNLEAVAKTMRAKLPDMTIIVCADDDYRTDGNHGLTKAKAAALAVGGKVAIPDFGDQRPEGAKDFNDVAVQCRPELVKRAIEAATFVERETLQDAPANAPQRAGEGGRFVTLVSAADIAPEPIDWLWNGWLARGKFHILGGAPGTGKTTLALDFAAIVSSGGRWPDGTRTDAGNVLIWSGEDDPANTLVPRLMASGANLQRVRFVTGTDGVNGKLPFDPATDMKRLQDAARALGDVHLLVVDPVVSAVAGDSHKNTETRRALQPLVDLGAALNCAVLGITHFAKGTSGRDPTERIIGSIAFAALARVVMVAAKSWQDDETGDGKPSRILMRAKSNIGPDDGGFGYDLTQTELPNHPGVIASHVAWAGAIDGSALELLANAEANDNDGEGGAMSDACAFLNDLLANGAVSAKRVKADANNAGLAWATVRRAKNTIGVVTEKTGMNGGWVWKLSRRCSTNTEDAQQINVSIFGKNEHLRDVLRPQSDILEVF